MTIVIFIRLKRDMAVHGIPMIGAYMVLLMNR